MANAIKIGNNSIGGVFIGSSSASSVYIGTTLIYSGGTPPTPPTPTTPKWVATYTGGTISSAECDSTSAITQGEITLENLISLEIGDCVTNIDDNAFYGCYDLTSVVIPDSVTNIGDYAFIESYSLTSVTIPSGVTSIGDSAFGGCGAESITCLATTPPTMGTTVFEYTSCPIYVPAASVDAYKEAEGWSDYSSRIQAIPTHDYSLDYLTFTALESGTFKFSNNSLDYSLDGGSTWTTLSPNTDSPTVNAGNKILWKASGLTPTVIAGIGNFSSTGQFNVEGNIMSLVFGDNFVGETDLTGKNYAFYGLFSWCSNLVSAENLVLPATTLAEYGCYQNMFSNCTSLTTAPELPATTLKNFCYQDMFNGCTNLNYIKCLATNISASYCTTNWVNGVSSSGTFVKDANMTSWAIGNNGIPSNWTVVDNV